MAKKFKGSTPIQRQYYNARERYNAARRKYKKQGAIFNENLFQPQSVTALAKRGASEQEFLQRIEAIEANLARLTGGGLPDLAAIGIQGMVDLSTGEYLEYNPSNITRIAELPYVQRQIKRNRRNFESRIKKETEIQERLQREREEIERELELERRFMPTKEELAIWNESYTESTEDSENEFEENNGDYGPKWEAEWNNYEDSQSSDTSQEYDSSQYADEEDYWDKKYYEDADEFYTPDERTRYLQFLDLFGENWFRDGDYVVHKKTGVRIPIEEFDSAKIPTEDKTIVKNVLRNLGGAEESTPKIVDAGGSSFDDSELNDIQNKLDTWDADPTWSYDLSQTKERDKNRAASILQGAIERDGYEAVARRIREHADTVGDILDNILYKTSGGTRDVYDNARDNVEENFVEFANIVNGRILSLDENERITEIYDEMNLYD